MVPEILQTAFKKSPKEFLISSSDSHSPPYWIDSVDGKKGGRGVCLFIARLRVSRDGHASKLMGPEIGQDGLP